MTDNIPKHARIGDVYGSCSAKRDEATVTIMQDSEGDNRAGEAMSFLD